MAEKNQEEKTLYELSFHLLPGLSEAQVAEEISKIKMELSSLGAESISESSAEIKNLAYPIAKQSDAKKEIFDRAYFGFMIFSGAKENLTKIQTALKADKQILRFLLVKLPESVINNNHKALPKRVSAFSIDKPIKPVAEKIELDKEKKITEDEIDKSIEDLVIN